MKKTLQILPFGRRKQFTLMFFPCSVHNSHGDCMNVWKRLVLGYLGGMGYTALELLWRGRSHWSMFLVGGICFLLIGWTEKLGLPLFVRSVAAAGMVTGVELLSGMALNLVLGLGVSNRPLVRLLLSRGIPVTGCDRTSREQLDEEVLELERLGAVLKLGPDYLEDLEGDVAFRTPGLHPDRPELLALRQRGTVLTSEMEAFFQVCPCPIIGITGSDGKTTTSTLISELLRQQGFRVWLGGNIGTPLLDKTPEMLPTDRVVVELSSFQLLGFPYSPHTAVVTNLAPNHLDMHRDMEEYVEAKRNLLLHQGPEDTVVLNLDNGLTRGFGDTAPGRVLWFSRQQKPERGLFYADDAIRRAEAPDRPLLRREDILLPGDHNVENYMAAIAAVGDAVSDEAIRTVARTFGGVEHRIELVRVKDGVRFYNDSIASSPTRTIAGLKSFDQKVILIAGGYDKGSTYDAFIAAFPGRVKELILLGKTAPKIKEAAQAAGFTNITMAKDMEECVTAAWDKASPGDVVLLSPACASWDMYDNFEQRGDHFRECAKKL